MGLKKIKGLEECSHRRLLSGFSASLLGNLDMFLKPFQDFLALYPQTIKWEFCCGIAVVNAPFCVCEKSCLAWVGFFSLQKISVVRLL